MEYVGVPGILDGLLLVDDALRAGLTSSPDFLRISDGFIRNSSSSSSSTSLSNGLRAGESNLFRGKSKNALASVFDLECEILRAPADRRNRGDSTGFDLLSLFDGSIWGNGRPRVNLAFFVDSLVCVSGEPARCCSIILIAACSSAKFVTSLALPRVVLVSSSLEVWDETGGDGSIETAGLSAGDWPLFVAGVSSLCRLSLSGLMFSGGLVSGVGSSDCLVTEGLRRCLFRYALDDDECGNSVLGPSPESDVSSAC